ncbi:9502_t:CDS:2 [Entrophospora sp. SA101]|nr:9498_t:CDS:2 [Entrophospora sp. SA101]CAJ0920697.1 9502_t:CDS:2 [Entrophospora sp. SA101]
MSDTLTIDQIRSKLRAGELFLKEKQGGRSDVWVFGGYSADDFPNVELIIVIID